MELFTPLTIGTMELPNRLVMAPMSRVRADRSGVPTDIMVEHYRQRASMGLIISDGIYPSFTGQGNALMPGLVTEDHVTGWKRVTDAVHEAGGRIVAQLMHSGRVAHENINGGRQPVAPSAIALEGMAHTYDGKQPYPVPHALTEAELPSIRDDAVMLLEENLADAAVVGRPVIANPDLARPWQEDHPLNEIDQPTVYTDGAAGYTDYPELTPVS